MKRQGKWKHFGIVVLISISLIFANEMYGRADQMKDLKGYIHPPNSYSGSCHDFLLGKDVLTLIYKMTGTTEPTYNYDLVVKSAGEKDGRGEFIAEYLDFKITGEYSGNHLTWDMVDEAGHKVSFIGECTGYGIAGWMGYTDRGDAENAYTYQVALFEKL